MTTALSVDLRKRVVAAVDGGLSRRQAAARFGVSTSSAIRWTSRVRETGDIRPLRVGGDKRSVRIEAFAPVILGAVEAKPDVTLVELREFLAEHGASLALSTIWRFFARHKITLKKSAHAAEQDRPDILARRRAWFDGQLDLDPERLIFIDETGARCLIPGFDGALFTLDWRDALWARFSTGAPRRLRRSVERYNIVKRA